MRTKYLQRDIDLFFSRLALYREALAKGSRKDIICTSLAIHAAKGNVPPRLRGLVNKTFKETKREIPLEMTTEELIEELQEKRHEFILNESVFEDDHPSWGEVAEAQAEAERKWDETDEGKELKALLALIGG